MKLHVTNTWIKSQFKNVYVKDKRLGSLQNLGRKTLNRCSSSWLVQDIVITDIVVSLLVNKDNIINKLNFILLKNTLVNTLLLFLLSLLVHVCNIIYQ